MPEYFPAASAFPFFPAAQKKLDTGTHLCYM